MLNMEKKQIHKILNDGIIEWRKHALERMLQRDISRLEVKEVLQNGEIIESYKDDKPFESALFFLMKEKPLHVVASIDTVAMKIHVITAYIADEKHFYSDFKRRKK